MDALRTTAGVAAAIVAWHNRHPLARRIGPDQVHGIGVVDLPLALPAPPRRGKARLLFSAQALYHSAPTRLAAWLQRHAQKPVSGPEDWPRRPLDIEPALAGEAEREGCTQQLVASVLTAVIDVDGQRLRVLLSEPGRVRVHGPRAFSPPRAVAALAIALVTATAGTGSILTSSAPPAPAAAIVAAVPPVVPPDVTPTPPPSPAAASAPEPAASAAPEPAVVMAAAPASAPASAPAMPRLGALINPATRDAARIQGRAMRSARAASAASPAAAASSATAQRVDGPVFAIATPPIARRETALAQMALWRGLVAQTPTATPTRLDLMPVGSQWRVVWWPHRHRADAARLLADVDARGLRAELIPF